MRIRECFRKHPRELGHFCKLTFYKLAFHRVDVDSPALYSPFACSTFLPYVINTYADDALL